MLGGSTCSLKIGNMQHAGQYLDICPIDSILVPFDAPVESWWPIEMWALLHYWYSLPCVCSTEPSYNPTIAAQKWWRESTAHARPLGTFTGSWNWKYSIFLSLQESTLHLESDKKLVKKLFVAKQILNEKHNYTLLLRIYKVIFTHCLREVRNLVVFTIIEVYVKSLKPMSGPAF